jgi:hypothetical protein
MLSETRKADRQKMAEKLAAAMTAAGAASVTVEPCSYAPQRIDVRINAPGGATILVYFDGQSCQPNVHVATWNTRGPVFLSPILGNVNPCHFGKMNVVGHGIDNLIQQLEQHMRRFVDGSGYLADDAPQIVAMGERYRANGWTWPLKAD